jgi:uncharacterized protein YjgD (DUF1641 family)
MMAESREDKAAEVLYMLMEKLAENGDSILKAMDKLIYLEKSGILYELLNLSEIALNLTKMPEELLDREIEDIATKNLELLLTLALSVDDDTVKFLNDLVDAFKEAKEFEPVGISGMLKAMRDPDVQKAIGFMLSFAKNLGKKL